MVNVRAPIAVLALVVVSGCAARMDHARRYEGPETLRVVNATSAPICELYVGQRDEHLWGRNWIRKSIAPGEHVDLALRPDDYMLRAGCGNQTALVAYRVAVDGDLALVIHDGYPPTTRDEAFADRVDLPTWTTWQHARLAGPNEGDVELRVHNRCAKDLRVVLGGDPSVRSGTPSTLPAHAALRYFAPEGTQLWLVDEAYRPVASTSLRSDTVDVAPTCDAFTAG